mgnify:FL=1
MNPGSLVKMKMRFSWVRDAKHVRNGYQGGGEFL